ncbi:MerR family transcriptional regulator [Kurthia sibirica]|nr:MerR family transcriptional regulator [Kurthia sibirica]GEK35122.1 hypothetical protein KSI01_26550 [Kurthia sibirica]
MKTTFGPAELAEAVGISKSTIKHYITILEKNGYEIQRDHRNYREFNEEDIAYFHAYKQLHNEQGLTLKEAATVITNPEFDISEVEIIPASKQQVVPANNKYELDRYSDLSNAMELLAEHVKGIESQNAQLLHLIQAQQQQNDLLMEQNNTLKNEFSEMKLQIAAPVGTESTISKKQLDRVESQNSVIMSAINRLNVEQHKAEVAVQEAQQKEQPKGLLKKIFGK